MDEDIAQKTENLIIRLRKENTELQDKGCGVQTRNWDKDEDAKCGGPFDNEVDELKIQLATKVVKNMSLEETWNFWN